MSADHYLPSPAGRVRRCFVFLAALAIIMAGGTCAGIYMSKMGNTDGATTISGNEQPIPAASNRFQDGPLQLTKQEAVPQILAEITAQDISSLIPEELTMQESAPQILTPVQNLSQHPLGDTKSGAYSK